MKSRIASGVVFGIFDRLCYAVEIHEMVVAFLLVVASFRVTLEKLVKFRLSAVGDLPVDLQIVLGQPEIENVPGNYRKGRNCLSRLGASRTAERRDRNPLRRRALHRSFRISTASSKRSERYPP